MKNQSKVSEISHFLSILLICVCVTNNSIAGEKAVENLPVATIQKIEIPQLRTVDATIEAVQQATVSAQTSGRITEITVDVDDYVQKGDVIIRLRDKEQRAAFDAAKARYEEALAEHKRVKEIYARQLVAKAVLDKAEAQLKATRAAMEQTREALENTQIRAPYSGIVVKRHVEVGETARVGQPLMTGLSLEKLRATVNLPQSLIFSVRQYQKAWVWLGEHETNKIASESLTISPFADPVTHTFVVRVNLAATDLKIYPGMHTKVDFMAGTQQSLVVPAAAIVHRGEVTGVYLMDNSHLRFQYVSVGKLLDGEQYEVLAGLQEGDKVSLEPLLATRQINNPVLRNNKE